MVQNVDPGASAETGGAPVMAAGVSCGVGKDDFSKLKLKLNLS